jgi:tetratricopeptide (TPR) repeat protein
MTSRHAARLLLCGALLLAAVPARAEPPELLTARGVARYQAGDLRGAVELLRRAVADAPDSGSAGHHLGLALIQLGQLTEGRRALAAAARATPSNLALLVDLGQAYLLEGNAAWAARTLEAALELEPKQARARYLHGLALLKLGDPQRAATALAGARGEGVDESDAALQLSLAYYLSGRYDESRGVLGPAFGGGDHRAARRLLRASLAAEGRPAALLSAELTFGAVVDTNPLYDHQATSKSAGAGPAISGSLTLRPWVTPKHAIWGELSAARSFYYPTADLPAGTVGPKEATPSELRGSAFYSFRTEREKGSDSSYEVSGGYSFGLVFLDGEPPLADRNHIFLEQHVGQLMLQRIRRGHGYSQLRYNLIRSQFADLARSNWGNEVGFEQTFSFLGERLRVLGWLTLRYESAHSSDYNQMVPGLGVGASYLGPLGLVFGLRAGYEHRDHIDSGTSARWSEQRIDNNLAFTAEISRALPWSLRLRAVYQRLQNLSTVTTFDYSRDLISLGVTWSGP